MLIIIIRKTITRKSSGDHQTKRLTRASPINLTAFRSDFMSFDPPSDTSRVGGVGVDVRGSGKVAIFIPLVSG
jgi:hypothetical protein